jgi:predicted Zn finger-like uncharacterized protein
MTLDSPGLPLARCPLCHTSAALSAQALAAGELWRCVTCGQTWTPTAGDRGGVRGLGRQSDEGRRVRLG